MKSAKNAKPIALPIARTKIRPSRMGWKRAAVLIAVQLAIAIHIAHWYKTGSTVSPIEPSEAMEFTKSGIINAGFIFFAIAIVSTLIFGRWFCGWGCHIVALQDFARWLLGLVRIRPRPIRSAVLSSVPLLAFIYMFIMPLLDVPALRLAGLEPSESARWAFGGAKLTTESFWETFPGVVGAVLTLLVCGFVIIYIFGAKGFCTTGCPYGAIFGAVDRFAPMRVRVNEDCTQSGHCTAVCSSNVRVHDEVREFGMVVDPGCMKCLDCVSVCPNDALSVGWGSTAFAPRHASPVKTQRPPRPDRTARAAQWGVWLLLAMFCVGTMAVFHGFDAHIRYELRRADWIFITLGAAVTLAILVIFRGRHGSPRECTVAEEALIAAFFLVGMIVFRGFLGLVPFLLSLAMSAIAAWMLAQACLLLARRQVSALGLRLKREGRLQRPALGFFAAVLGLLVLMGAGALDTGRNVRAGMLRAEYAAMLPQLAEDLAAPNVLERAIEVKQKLAALEPARLDHSFDLARLTARDGRLDDVPGIYESLLARPGLIKGDAARIHFEYAMFESLRGRPDAVINRLSRAVADAPEWVDARVTLGQVFATTGRIDAAAEQIAIAVRLAPDNADLRMMLAGCYVELDRRPEARREVEAASKLAPDRADIAQALEALR